MLVADEGLACLRSPAASSLPREALGVEDRELVHRLLPMMRGHMRRLEKAADARAVEMHAMIDASIKRAEELELQSRTIPSQRRLSPKHENTCGCMTSMVYNLYGNLPLCVRPPSKCQCIFVGQGRRQSPHRLRTVALDEQRAGNTHWLTW